MLNFTNIFSDIGQSRLKKFLASDPDVLFAFDFDGTLAPIVENPAHAAMAAEVFVKLDALSKKRKVIVLTGRSIEDIRKRLPSTIFRVIGSHGLEGHPDVSRKFLLQAKSTTQKWIEELRDRLEGLHRVWIEDKTYSMAIHYRVRASSHDLPTKLRSVCSLLDPSPEVILGKNVINLIPQGMPNKLGALRAIMKELNAKKAFFIGDDITDEFIFADKNENVFSLKVGTSSHLSAEHYIQKQADIERLIDFLLDNTN